MVRSDLIPSNVYRGQQCDAFNQLEALKILISVLYMCVSQSRHSVFPVSKARCEWEENAVLAHCSHYVWKIIYVEHLTVAVNAPLDWSLCGPNWSRQLQVKNTFSFPTLSHICNVVKCSTLQPSHSPQIHRDTSNMLFLRSWFTQQVCPGGFYFYCRRR